MASFPSFFISSGSEKAKLQLTSSYPGKCVHNISGAQAEVNARWWPAPTEIRTLGVFVPGNPGVIEFYDSFLDALHLRCKERGLAILAHGMLGHAPHLPTPKFTGLLHQVESLNQVLAKIRKEWAKIRVIVICHSAGAWVATQLEPILTQSSGYFRYFQIYLSPGGKSTSWLFNRPLSYILALLAIFLRPFAPFFVRLLFRRWPSEQQEALLSLVRSPSAILSCLAMVQEEMKTILMPDEYFLKQHSAKLWLYYGVEDHWVGAERERIINILENPAGLRIVHCKHGIPHDFSILHGELIAEQCGVWLESGDLI